MTRDIDVQAAPGEAWFVFDDDGGHDEARCAGFYQLQESREAVQNTERIRGAQARLLRRHFKAVAFVFTEFLYCFAGGVAADYKFCVRRITENLAEWNTGLESELTNESSGSGVDSWIWSAER